MLPIRLRGKVLN